MMNAEYLARHTASLQVQVNPHNEDRRQPARSLRRYGARFASRLSVVGIDDNKGLNAKTSSNRSVRTVFRNASQLE